MKEYRIYYALYRILLRFLYAIFFIKCEIEGEENLDFIEKNGCGAIFASNHISNLDPVLYMLVRTVPISFFAKHTLFRVPVLGWCMRKCGQLSVNRGAPDASAIREAIAKIREGRVVGIFPEGTRSPDAVLREGKPGCGMIAFRSKAVVVPAAIWGSHEILPKNRFVPRVASVRIKIGKPIYLDEFFGREDLSSEEERAIFRQITDKIMKEIRTLYESMH